MTMVLKADAHPLTVEQRLDAALTVMRREQPNERPSIAALCRAAKVSRANVYESHREYLSKLRPVDNDARRPGKDDNRNKERRGRGASDERILIETLQRQNRVLMISCLGLRLQLADLEREVTELRVIQKSSSNRRET